MQHIVIYTYIIQAWCMYIYNINNMIYIYILVYNMVFISISHMLHVWYIYLHLPEENHPNVGKYTIHGAYGYGSIPISTIFRVMNIHLPAILMFTRCHMGIITWSKFQCCMIWKTHARRRSVAPGKDRCCSSRPFSLHLVETLQRNYETTKRLDEYMEMYFIYIYVNNYLFV